MFAFKLAQENGLILSDLPDFKDTGEALRYVKENGDAFEGKNTLLMIISIRKRFTISSEVKTVVREKKMAVKKPAKKKGEKE